MTASSKQIQTLKVITFRKIPTTYFFNTSSAFARQFAHENMMKEIHEEEMRKKKTTRTWSKFGRTKARTWKRNQQTTKPRRI